MTTETTTPSIKPEFRDFFEQLPKLSENSDLRVISAYLFDKVISEAMEKAFYYGKVEGFQECEGVVNNVLGALK